MLFYMTIYHWGDSLASMQCVVPENLYIPPNGRFFGLEIPVYLRTFL